eukprot:COSAG05_NODE_301_length_11860_cov_30.927812_8_plen_626_part_00
MADMDNVRQQRWALLGGAVTTFLSTGYILLSYNNNKRLRRRPGSILCWRAACNMGFSAAVILNEVGYAIRGDFPSADCLDGRAQPDPTWDPPALQCGQGLDPAIPCPSDCVCGTRQNCRAMSFAMQWFALGVESYYFVLSIDLLLNLVLSPFGSPTSRTKYYHIFVVFTSTASAIALSAGQSWGPSGAESAPGTYQMMHVCWMKAFSIRKADIANRFWTGWGYMYAPAAGYYLFGVLVLVYCWWWLRRGIPQTLKVRQRQMVAGTKLVVVLTVYLASLFIVFNEILNNQDVLWVKVFFAAWFGARGIADAFVWLLVVVPAAVERDGRDLTPWWRGGSGGATRGMSASRLSRGNNEPLLAGSSASQPINEDDGYSGSHPKGEEREGEELNIALRDEVLYFTLVGLRAAAAGEHMGGSRRDEARPLDLEAAIGCPPSASRSCCERLCPTVDGLGVVGGQNPQYLPTPVNSRCITGTYLRLHCARSCTTKHTDWSSRYPEGMTPGFGARSTSQEADVEDIDNLRWALKRMKFTFTRWVVDGVTFVPCSVRDQYARKYRLCRLTEWWSGCAVFLVTWMANSRGCGLRFLRSGRRGTRHHYRGTRMPILTGGSRALSFSSRKTSDTSSRR